MKISLMQSAGQFIAFAIRLLVSSTVSLGSTFTSTTEREPSQIFMPKNKNDSVQKVGYLYN